MMWLLLRIVLPATVLTSISPNANMYTWLYHVKEYQQLQSSQYFWTVYGWAVEHIVSSDLSWSNHISSICGKAKKILGLLYRQYYNHVEEDVLKQLYISLKLSDHTWNTVELSGMLHTLNISNLHVKWHQSTGMPDTRIWWVYLHLNRGGITWNYVYYSKLHMACVTFPLGF